MYLNLKRAGFNPQNVQKQLSKMMSNIHLTPLHQNGHRNHVSCTMVSRPLRPLDKVEQLLKIVSNFHRHRLDDLENAHLIFCSEQSCSRPRRSPECKSKAWNTKYSKTTFYFPYIKNKKSSGENRNAKMLRCRNVQKFP